MSLLARIATLARRDAIATTGVALAAVWLLLVGLFWLMSPATGGDPESAVQASGVARLTVMMGAVMPLVLIGLAVRTARAIALLRAEAEDLRRRLADLQGAAGPAGAMRDASRQDPLAPRAQPDQGGAPPAPRPPAPAAAPAQPPAAAAAPRPLPRGLPEDRGPDRRPAGTDQLPVDAETLIRALNFPDGADDSPAIIALRRALLDPRHVRVLRAAQDVVTLLAGQDLYMDDLPPDPAPAAAWRRFADGARGSAVAAVGAIHDTTAMAVVSALLDRDEIFRDTAHHFLRHFDAMLTRQVPQMDDAQIAALAQTRSARAFMLLGRIAGIFG